jgi:hypothetical protein
MEAKAYIVSIPESLDLENILRDKPELRSYPDEDNNLEETYENISNILDEIKNNVETEISGNVVRMAIMYFLIEYAQEHDEFLGELRIPGKLEKIFNVDAANIKDNTKHNILQQGLLSGLRRIYGL